MENKLAAIVIPIYKQLPSDNEQISLNQCIKILNKYPILFFGPKNLDTSYYEKICTGKISFQFIPFEEHYFKGVAGYNTLMLSPLFYHRFFAFKFILIYQLDAYVFKDEMHYWCEQNYDFIGAPNLDYGNQLGQIRFLKGYRQVIDVINRLFNTKHQIRNVGNGGFSLRKTKKFYWILKLLANKVTKWGNNNEDEFFKYWGNILYPFFKLPPEQVALKFSLERNIKAALEKNSQTLPFGCHAFEKYEPEEWKKYIKFKQA